MGKAARIKRQEERRRREASNWTEDIPHPVEEFDDVLQGSQDQAAGPAGGLVPLLLTVAELCELLHVSRMTLHRLEKSGELPGRVKLGGQVRYHREIIEKWLLERIEK